MSTRILALLALVALASCEGNPPHTYYDYSYLEFDGEEGGVARVGMDVPLGSTFSPAASQEIKLARQQLGATLALVEATRGLAPSPDPAPEPAPDAPDVPTGPGEGLSPMPVDPVTYYQKLAAALSWESLCKLMLLTFFGVEMRRRQQRD